MSLKLGDLAPDFSLMDSTGALVGLDTYNTKKIVLYFYPKDNTPGCTLEAKDFSRLRDEFVSVNAVVLGISADDQKKHENFIQCYDLRVSLLSDTDYAVCSLYGVWKERSMFGKKYMGIERSTFLIDSDRKILQIWRSVKVEHHALRVLEAIRDNIV